MKYFRLQLLNVYTACTSPHITVSTWKRCYSISGNPTADRALNVVTGGRIESWFQKYEDLVGLTEVKEAQNKVIQVCVCSISNTSGNCIVSSDVRFKINFSLFFV